MLTCWLYMCPYCKNTYLSRNRQYYGEYVSCIYCDKEFRVTVEYECRNG